MTASLLELSKELTLTLIETGKLSSEDMQDTLNKTYATLSALKAQEEHGTSAMAAVAQTTTVDWRKSITKHAVTCMECGESFKQLSVRHLRMHGLDGRSYRAKYSMPRSQPLAAKEVTMRRREVVRQTRPWEKAARVRSAQARGGHTATEPEQEALPEAPQELAAAVSTPQKKQRKTAPQKKTAGKKSVPA